MKKLIVVLAIVLLAGVVWAEEMPITVNTNLDATSLTVARGDVLLSGGTNSLLIAPTWSGISSEGEILIASAKEFDQNLKRRIIKVYVVDPSPNVPMDKCILYQSQEHLTDLTDQEIFFGLKFSYPAQGKIKGMIVDLNIEDFLKAYNSDRIKWPDKKLSRETGRDVHLEPVKIRELKMVIVNIATF